MSIAITDFQTRSSVAQTSVPQTLGNTARAVAPAPAQPAPHLRAVPEGTEVRGFVLYVGLGELAAQVDGVDLSSIVTQLKALTAQLAPHAQTHAAVALAPEGAGGRDVDVVRRALQDPALRTPAEQPAAQPEADSITIDVSRRRVVAGDEILPLTFKEFELLRFVVLREGRTVEREEIIDGLWGADDVDRPNTRTIDVHIRRLRVKLGHFADIIRTVRGQGYRFDRHADVAILAPHGPSSDAF